MVVDYRAMSSVNFAIREKVWGDRGKPGGGTGETFADFRSSKHLETFRPEHVK